MSRLRFAMSFVFMMVLMPSAWHSHATAQSDVIASAQSASDPTQATEDGASELPSSTPGSSIPANALDDAYLQISQDKPRVALRMLDAILAREPENPWAWYFRGLALVQLDQPHDALNAFEEARLYAGRLHADGAEPDQDLMEAISGAAATARRSLFSFNLRSGFFYDTNVSFVDEAAAQPGLIAGDEDAYFGLSADSRIALYHARDTRVWLDLRTAQSWHFEIDSFDYQSYGGSLSIRHAISDYVAVEAGYDYDADLLGRDMFGSFQRGRLRVDAMLPFENEVVVPRRTSLFYHLESNDFLFPTTDEAFDQDALGHVVGIEQVVRVSPVVDSPAYIDLILGYQFSHYDTDGTEFQRRQHRFHTGLAAPILNPLGEGEYLLIPELPMRLEMGMDWMIDDYTEASLIDRDGGERRDRILRYRVALSQVLVDDPVYGQLTFRFLFQFLDADSNVITEDRRQPFDYDKALYGLQLHWSW
ncbi:MAG: tetratricopeptide repeat protein [Phycisphaerae bacterium]